MKHKYEASELFADDLEYWGRYLGEKAIKDEANREFIDDLIDPNKTPLEMAYKYGRDYIRYYKSYNAFRLMILTGEVK